MSPIRFVPALLLLAAPLAAQQGGFANPAAIDAEVAAFTGASAGTPGGARAPVDQRLRLAACTLPLELAWHGRGESMVQVECNGSTAWRIFVPVAGHDLSSTARTPVVARGQVLTVTVAGRGFSVSQQGEALEEGAIGDWIEVRPQGRRETLRARVVNPALAVIAMGGS